MRKVGEIEIDHSQRKVSKDGKAIHLTGLEFGLLDYLCSHPNRICTRTELIDHIWGNRFQYDIGTIDVHLSAIRRKLGYSKHYPIETIRGAGFLYRIEEKSHRYTIDLQSFAQEWLSSHSVSLLSKGLSASISLSPFVNEITISPESLRTMLDATLSALLPSANPGKLKLSSKLTMQYFILSLDINGTISELRIPISTM